SRSFLSDNLQDSKRLGKSPEDTQDKEKGDQPVIQFPGGQSPDRTVEKTAMRVFCFLQPAHGQKKLSEPGELTQPEINAKKPHAEMVVQGELFQKGMIVFGKVGSRRTVIEDGF